MVISRHYAPLKSQSNFRILVLEPASVFSDALKAHLIDAKVDDHPPYEALSYAWGRPTVTGKGTVELHGEAVEITSNLESALRHLRLQRDPRHIWVDALCINQHDLAERSSQVSFMRDIYAKCTADLLWLGDVDMQEISSALKAMGELGTITNALALLQRDGDDDLVRDKLYDVCAFFKQPKVWHRAWVMQEVAAAPKVQIVAGHMVVDWSDVEEFLDADVQIRRFGIPDMYHAPYSHWFSLVEDLNNELAIPQILCHQRRLFRTAAGSGYESGSSLKDVLARFRNTRATDPRDKIYSFLGLTSDALSILPDYERGVAETFIEVSKQIIEKDGNLDLLCQGPWAPGRLHSWVPNYEWADSASIMFAQRGIFNAGRDNLTLPLRITSDGAIILEGILLESLKEVRYTWARLPGYSVLQRAFALMPDQLLREVVLDGNKSFDQLMDRSALRNLTMHSDYGVSGAAVFGGVPSSSDENSGRANKRKPSRKEGSGGARRSSADSTTASQRQANFRDFWRTILLDCRRSDGLLRRLQPSDIDELCVEFERARMSPIGEVNDDRLEPDIRKEMLRNLNDWMFTTTESGIPGMAARSAAMGDFVVLLKGAKVPILLRPNEGDSTKGEPRQAFTWVGPCYVHSYMDGHALDEADVSQKTRDFFIK